MSVCEKFGGESAELRGTVLPIFRHTKNRSRALRRSRTVEATSHFLIAGKAHDRAWPVHLSMAQMCRSTQRDEF